MATREKWYVMGLEEGVHSIRCDTLHVCHAHAEEMENCAAWDRGFREGQRLARVALKPPDSEQMVEESHMERADRFVRLALKHGERADTLEAEKAQLLNAVQQFADPSNWSCRVACLQWMGKRNAIEFAESVLTTLSPPNAGTIYVGGEPIATMPVPDPNVPVCLTCGKPAVGKCEGKELQRDAQTEAVRDHESRIALHNRILDEEKARGLKSFIGDVVCV